VIAGTMFALVPSAVARRREGAVAAPLPLPLPVNAEVQRV
jgi:hypothetical protein